VLSNFVLSHLEKQQKETRALQDYRIIYYFCNIRVQETQRTAESILRSLIVQLCEDRRLFLQLPQDLRERPENFHAASVDTLWDHFQSLLSHEVSGCTYCVIDGLDVYKTGMRRLVDNLAGLFYPEGSKTRPYLKLFCTSRPTPDLSPMLEKFHSRTLRSRRKDLEVFIKSQVAALPSNVSEDIKDTIIEDLQEHVGQTFLWVAIILRKILSLATTRTALRKKDVITEIKKSDKDLDDLYRTTILQAISKDHLNAAIFVWTAFCRKPLGIVALSEAISFRQEEPYTLVSSQITEKLGILLDVIDDKVYLIHQSLRDFLESRMPDEMKRYIGNDYQHYLASICTNYLASLDIDRASPRDAYSDFDSIKRGFLLYASSYWDSYIYSVDDAQKLLPSLEQILPMQYGKANIWISLRTGVYAAPLPKGLTDIALYFDMGWLAELILGQYSSKLSDEFTPSCLIKAAAKAGNVLKVLCINKRTKDFQVTEEVLRVAANNWENGEAVMRLLLDERGQEFKITEGVVKVAADNVGNGEAVMRLLLDERGDEVKITEEVLKEAAENGRNGEAVMRLLLDRRWDEVRITEEVFEAAARNRNDGEAVMKLLLDQRGQEFKITEEVVKAAAENNEAVMRLLLKRRWDEVKITEEVVEAAAENETDGEAVMRLLLDERGDEVKITEEVLKVAACNFENGEALIKLLLDERGDEVKITEEVLIAAASNDESGRAVMRLLLDQRGQEDQITEEVLEMAACSLRNGEAMMNLLLDKVGQDVQITEKVVKAAAENDWYGEAVMRLLLDRRGDDVQITKKVMKAVAKNRGNGEALIRLLLNKRGKEVQIIEEVLEMAVGNCIHREAARRLFLNRRGDEVPSHGEDNLSSSKS
jgi:hypothetical protein